jgi:hypothetical protein
MTGSSLFDLLILVVVFGAFYIIIKLSKTEAHYDERQLKIRGDAYKFSLFTVMILLVLVGFSYGMDEINISHYIDTEMILFSIAYIGVIVFAVYSIIKDAFFDIQDKGNNYILLIACVLLANIAALISNIQGGYFLKNGILSFENGGAALLNLFCFGLVLIVIAVKKMCYKKELVG